MVSLTSRIISAIFESLKTFDKSLDDFTPGLGRQVIQISKDSWPGKNMTNS